MRSKTLLVMFWAVFSLSACGTVRPKGDICLTNAARGYRLCYDMEKDFDSNGDILPGREPHYKRFYYLNDVDRHVVFDPDSWAEVKAFVRFLKEKYEKCSSVTN